MFIDDGGAGGGGGSGTTEPPVKEEPKKTEFTPEQQKLVDSIVEGRLAKTKTEIENLRKLNEQLTSTKSMTEEQTTKLREQMESLQRTVLSKEELAAKEKKELSEQLANQMKALEDSNNRWKGLFESHTIERAIRDSVAVGDTKAVNPNQFVALLGRDTKVVEEVDKDGKPTGRHVTVTRFLGQDKDGKSVEMELPTPEAVKEMRKIPTLYGNLFESGLTAGLGGTKGAGTGSDGLPSDEDLSDHDTYMKHREKLKNA